MAVKVMSSYQLPLLRKWVLIYMPDPNRNQVRAIWTKSVQALNEKLKAPRNSFLHLLRFCFHGTQWPGMIFEHIFCDMCLCDHSPMRKHIGLVLFRCYRRLEGEVVWGPVGSEGLPAWKTGLRGEGRELKNHFHLTGEELDELMLRRELLRDN